MLAADVVGSGSIFLFKFQVCYTTLDGTVLRSPSQARSYLASSKKMEADDAEEILAALVCGIRLFLQLLGLF